MRDPATVSTASATTATAAPATAPRVLVALDADLVGWFEARVERIGGDPVALLNAVLRDHVRRADEPLERTLRRVLREELRKAG